VIEGPVPVREVLAAGVVLDEVFVDADAWSDAEPGSALHDAVVAVVPPPPGPGGSPCR